MTQPHENAVKAQFGPRARAYVESAVHAQGADIQSLAALAARLRPSHALDLGAGGGHVSYAIAPQAAQVTAVDLSPEMLAAIRATAAERSLTNIVPVEAAVESLPFEAGSFDFLCSRFSAHHWRDFEGGLREGRRVLAPGKTAVFIDVFASSAPMFDTHLQAVELLRDASHARDYTLAEWTSALGRAGFALRRCSTWRLKMEFASWTGRMNTPAPNREAIRVLQAAAPAGVRDYFEIEDDGSFQIDVTMMETVAQA